MREDLYIVYPCTKFDGFLALAEIIGGPKI